MGDIFMTRHNTLRYGESSIRRHTGAQFLNNIPLDIKLSPPVMSFRRQLTLQMFSTKY